MFALVTSGRDHWNWFGTSRIGGGEWEHSCWYLVVGQGLTWANYLLLKSVKSKSKMSKKSSSDFFKTNDPLSCKFSVRLNCVRVR
jgi:hypothetical protein